MELIDEVLVPSHLPVFYTIIVSGVEFKLTQSQIEFNSPNYFTAAFLEHDFVEAQSKILVLDKDPLLFRYIVLYLSGYEIFPLQLAAIPITMSIETATRNLAIDADYFGLDSLIKKIEDYKLSLIPFTCLKPDLLSELGFKKTIIEMSDLVDRKLNLLRRINPATWNPIIELQGANPNEDYRILIRIRNCSIRMNFYEVTAESTPRGATTTRQIVTADVPFFVSYPGEGEHLVTIEKVTDNYPDHTFIHVKFGIIHLGRDPNVPIIIDNESGTLSELWDHFFPDTVHSGETFSNILADIQDNSPASLLRRQNDTKQHPGHRCLSLFASELLVEIIEPALGNELSRDTLGWKIIAGKFLRRSTAAKSLFLN